MEELSVIADLYLGYSTPLRFSVGRGMVCWAVFSLLGWLLLLQRCADSAKLVVCWSCLVRFRGCRQLPSCYGFEMYLLEWI